MWNNLLKFYVSLKTLTDKLKKFAIAHLSAGKVIKTTRNTHTHTHINMVRRVFIVSSFVFSRSFSLFLFLFLLLLGRRDMIGSIDFCFPKRHASLMGITTTTKKFKKKNWKRRRIALLFFDDRVMNRVPFLFFV